jgi:predicted O-linked N-acetylglucosamine transferase (SPINDLY family)
MNPQLQLMLQHAIQAFQTNNLDRAESILKKILQQNSKNLPALHIFSLIKASQEKYQEAIKLFGKAVRINPNGASIQYNLTKALMDLENNEQFKGNIFQEFSKRGINTDQIIFAKKVDLMSDHLARYTLADLFLDTNPYNAHTTAVDSLKAGLPVPTVPSKPFARLLNAIGLPDHVSVL